MTRAGIILAAMLLSASAPWSGRHRVTADLGGEISAYAREIDAAARAGERYEIDGVCASACTMRLALGCVTPRAVIGFHGPRGVGGRVLTAEEADLWARIMATYYPPRLAEWWMRSARWRRTPIWLNADAAVRMGVERCR